MATNQNRLDDVLATLADAHIKTQEQFRETDRRIADLVSGIGEFIRKMDERRK